METIARFPVHVLMRRTPLASRWASESWAPLGVEIAGAPRDDLDVSPLPPVCLRDDSEASVWRFAGHALELHRSEAEGYYLNLREDAPVVFVLWRRDESRTPPVTPVLATVSYNEAARAMDGGETVDAVPMPAEIRAWVAPFMSEHYRPEPKGKQRRNDPFVAGAFRKQRGPAQP